MPIETNPFEKYLQPEHAEPSADAAEDNPFAKYVDPAYDPEAERGGGGSGLLRDLAVRGVQGLADIGGAAYGLANVATLGKLDSATRGVARVADRAATAIGNALTGQDVAPTSDAALPTVAQGVQRVDQALEGHTTQEMRDLVQLRQQAMQDAAADGPLAEFVAGAWTTLNNPRLLSGDLMRSGASMLAPGAAAGALARRVGPKIAQEAAERALAAGATREAAELAGREAAAKLSERAVIGVTGMGQVGGSANVDAINRTYDLSPQVLEANPRYQELIASGMDPQAARDEMARMSGLTSFAVAAPLSMIASKATGAGRQFSDIMTGNYAGRRIADLARAGLRESGQEIIESGGEALASNVAQRQYGDTSTPLMQGVYGAMGIGGIAGGVMGLGGHVAGNMNRRQPPAPQAAPDQPASAPGQPLPVEVAGANAAFDSMMDAPVPPAPAAPAAPVLPPDAGPNTRAAAIAIGAGSTRPAFPFTSAELAQKQADELARVSGFQYQVGPHPTVAGRFAALPVMVAPEPGTQQAAQAPTATAAPLQPGQLPQVLSNIDAAAHEAASSPLNERSDPSGAQAQVGNYKKGKASVAGLAISFENPAGSVRRDKQNDPPQWETTMQDHYGYFKGVAARSPDKEHVDVFVKNNTADDWNGNAYIIDQGDEQGEFDEAKVVLGAESPSDARATYLRNYEAGFESRILDITEVPLDGLRALLDDPDGFMQSQLGRRFAADLNGMAPAGDAMMPPATADVPETPAQTPPAVDEPVARSKPRLAENADDLYRAVQKATDEGGVHVEGRGLLPPVVRVLGVGDMRVSSQGVEVLGNGGMTARAATSSEIDELHDAIEKDQAQVLVMTRWGGSGRDTASKPVLELHSPSGNSYQQRALPGQTPPAAAAAAEPDQPGSTDRYAVERAETERRIHAKLKEWGYQDSDPRMADAASRGKIRFDKVEQVAVVPQKNHAINHTEVRLAQGPNGKWASDVSWMEGHAGGSSHPSPTVNRAFDSRDEAIIDALIRLKRQVSPGLYAKARAASTLSEDGLARLAREEAIPDGDRPRDVHYPKRRPGFQHAYVRESDRYNAPTWATLAAANMQSGDTFTLGGTDWMVEANNGRIFLKKPAPSNERREVPLEGPEWEAFRRDLAYELEQENMRANASAPGATPLLDILKRDDAVHIDEDGSVYASDIRPEKEGSAQPLPAGIEALFDGGITNRFELRHLRRLMAWGYDASNMPTNMFGRPSDTIKGGKAVLQGGSGKRLKLIVYVAQAPNGKWGYGVASEAPMTASTHGASVYSPQFDSRLAAAEAGMATVLENVPYWKGKVGKDSTHYRTVDEAYIDKLVADMKAQLGVLRGQERAGTAQPDSPAWKATPFASRIEAMLEQLREGAPDMVTAFESGTELDAKQGKLTEETVAFREDKARQIIAGNASKDMPPQPVKIGLMTPDKLAEITNVVPALPKPIVAAAVAKWNELAPKLAALGFKYGEVNTSHPQNVREAHRALQDVATALDALAARRYFAIKNPKQSKPENVARAEKFASDLLGIDTLAHPGVDTTRQITLGEGVKEPLPKKTAPEKEAPPAVTPVVREGEGGKAQIDAARLVFTGAYSYEVSAALMARVQEALRTRPDSYQVGHYHKDDTRISLPPKKGQAAGSHNGGQLIVRDDGRAALIGDDGHGWASTMSQKSVTRTLIEWLANMGEAPKVPDTARADDDAEEQANKSEKPGLAKMQEAKAEKEAAAAEQARDEAAIARARRAGQREIYNMASRLPQLLQAAALPAEQFSARADEAIQAWVAAQQASTVNDPARLRMLDGMVADGKTTLPKEFFASLQKYLAREQRRAALMAARDPQAYQAALREASEAAKLPTDKALVELFVHGWDHALAGRTKSTLRAGEWPAKGYEAALAWRDTDAGRAWYTGKRGKKLQDTGAELRRWFDEATRRIKQVDAANLPASYALIKEQASRVGAFASVAGEGATPGTVRYITAVRDLLRPFQQWLLEAGPLDRLRGASWRGSESEHISEFLNGDAYLYDDDWQKYGIEDADSDGSTPEQRLLLLQKAAARYMDLVQRVAEALAGSTTVAEAAARLDGAMYTKSEEGSFKTSKLTAFGKEVNELFKRTGRLHRYMPGGYDTQLFERRENEPDGAQDKKAPLVVPKLDRVVREVDKDKLRDWRRGKNVTPAQMKKTFGFADVGFGHYVAAGQDQDHLNYAYDAFMDLADFLGIDPKHIGLNGTLYFTIGKLGHGKHAAHFQARQKHPDGRLVPVINVTNTKGDGTVAHEWAHALDHALSGGIVTTSKAGRQTWKQHLAVTKVVHMLTTTGMQADGLMDLARHYADGSRFWIKGGSRSNKPLWNLDTEEGLAANVREALRQYAGGIRGDSTTRYKREADNMGADYWGNDKELLARAFEAHVLDNLKGISNYLVNPEWVGEGKISAPTYKGAPYPMGEERKRFSEGLAVFIKSLRFPAGEAPTVDMDAFLAEFPDAEKALKEAKQAVLDRLPELVKEGLERRRAAKLADKLAKDEHERRKQELAQAEQLAKDAAARAEAEQKAQAERAKAEAAAQAERERLLAEAAEQPLPPANPLSDEELSDLFDEALGQIESAQQEQPEAADPGEELASLAEGKWTRDDIEYLLKSYDAGTVFLLADDKLGLPTIHDISARAVHKGYGMFELATPSYTVQFEAGGAMRSTPGGKSFTAVTIKDGRGAFLEAIGWDGVKAKLQARLIVKTGPKAAPTLADQQEKTAAKLIAEAAKHGVTGIDEALKGLTKLFGGGPGKLQSFPGGMDEDAYQQAKPHFEAALRAFQAAGKSLLDLFKLLIQNFGAGVKPYALRFAKEQGLTASLGAPGSGTTKVAEWVRGKLNAAEPFTSKQLFEVADDAFGGSQAAGTYSVKDAYDAMEAGVNRYVMSARLAPAGSADDAARAIAQLERVLERLPTQTRRTEEMDEYQQFSTPPQLAYAAAWAANIGTGETLLEPSAGVGGLAMYGELAGARLVVNELSSRRAAVLAEVLPQAQQFSENAEQLHNVLPENIKPTVVLMNPPFSASAGRLQGLRDTMIGAGHVEQALKRLEQGGRLVAIVGNGMAADRAAFKPWWDKIKQDYNVRANIGVDGGNYAKYGTTFDNQLLVIDKTGPTTGAVLTGQVATVGELPALLEAIRNDRQGTSRAGQAGQPAAAEQGGGAMAGGTAAGDRAGGTDPDALGAGERGDTAAAGAGAPGRGADDGADQRDDGVGAAAGGEVPDQPGDGRGHGAARRRSGNSGGRAGSGRGAAGKPVQRDGGQQPVGSLDVQAADGLRAEGELTDAIFEDYAPQRLKIPGARPHPGKLVQSAAMAAVLPPAPTYAPHLPKKVIEKGLLSLAQLEAVVYAGQAHAELLRGERERRGFFIGDGTGVGKGREIAGILLDNWNQGRKKAVWLSAKQGLLRDAQRDFGGIGGDPALILAHSKVKADAKIDAKQGILFTTYDTLRSGFDQQPNIGPFMDAKQLAAAYPKGTVLKAATGGTYQLVKWDHAKSQATVTRFGTTYRVGFNQIEGAGSNGRDWLSTRYAKVTKPADAPPSRLDQIVQWLGPDFDGVIAFDEAHNMGNVFPKKGKRGQTKPAAKALAGVELQRRLPKARVVYVSATGATEVANLGYATRLGLWGEGTAFAQPGDFIGAIEGGGVAAMELVSRDMKASGSYLARSLSFEGVTYDRLEHELTPLQTDIYNELARAWQLVLANINKALEDTGQDHSAAAKSAALAKFWGAHQRFFNHIITALQTPAIIEAAQRDLAAGHAVVLQLVNTNEAEQERQAAKIAGDDNATLEDFDFTPRETLINYVRHSFPVTQYEEYTDSEGKSQMRPATDSAGRPVENRELVQLRDQMVKNLEQIRVPDNPMDMLINAFGPDNVAEITGRKRRFVQVQQADGSFKVVEQKRPASAITADADAFLADKKRVLVFSDAGGTGYSFQSDLGVANQRRRIHYLVQPGWRANNAVQGFGRTHRSNEANQPHYVLPTTNLKAQKRFISSIARRLDQLGALTKGQRETGGQGMFAATDNLESQYAHDALRNLFLDMYNGTASLPFQETTQALGLNGLVDQNGALVQDKLPEVPQFLNRLLSLTTDRQDVVFDEFFRRLEETIERAKAQGTFDAGMETLRAAQAEKVREETVYQDPRTGAATRYIELELTHKVKFNGFDEVLELAQVYGDGFMGFYRSERTDRVFALVRTGTSTNNSGATVMRGWRMGVAGERRYGDDVEQVLNGAAGRSKVRKKVLVQGYTPPTGGLAPEKYTDAQGVERQLTDANFGRVVGNIGLERARAQLLQMEAGPKRDAAERLLARMEPHLDAGTEKDVEVPSFTELTEAEARAAWAAEQQAMNPTYTSRTHLLTGILLPVWDRLRGTPRVVRTQTIDGERLLGRLVAEADLKDTLRNLGVGSNLGQLPAARVAERIMDGERAVLANGWIIKKSRVSNDARMELIGRNMYGPDRQLLVQQGAFVERINWEERVFIPTGQAGVPVLERILSNKPLVDLGKDGSQDDDAVFSRGDAAEGMDAAAVNEVVRSLTAGWRNAPTVAVVQSTAELPFKAPGDTRGAYYQGRVWLVADRLANAAEAEFVLAHEALGHLGLAAIMGPKELAAELNRLRMINPQLAAEARAQREKYGYDLVLATEEALADRAGSGQPIRGWQKFVAKVQAALRALGLNRVADWIERHSQAETMDLLRRAREAIEGRRAPRTFGQVEAARFSDGAAQLWYSELARQVRTMPMKAAPARQWAATLEGLKAKGVKAEEIEWTGVLEWLGLQDGKVTKEALLEYLAGNGVQVAEVLHERRAVVQTEANRTDWIEEQVTLARAMYESWAGDEMARRMENHYHQFYTAPESGDGNGRWLLLHEGRGEISSHDSELAAAGALREAILSERAEREEAIYSSLTPFNEAGAREDAEEEWDNEHAHEDTTEYGKYTLPGGAEYKELLLTLPAKRGSSFSGTLRFPSEDAAEGLMVDLDMNGLERLDYGRAGERWVRFNIDGANYAQFMGLARKHGGQVVSQVQNIDDGLLFQSKHWAEKNVLAHIRFDERRGANGEKVLFVEELQSDWQQAGRRQGFKYGNEQKFAQVRQQLEQRLAQARAAIASQAEDIAQLLRPLQLTGGNRELDTAVMYANLARHAYGYPATMVPPGVTPEMVRQVRATVPAPLVRRAQELYADWQKVKDEWVLRTGAHQTGKGVPDAPFVATTTGWLELALKRLITYAAHNGFDQVAFINGEQSAERYDLSKHASKVTVARTPDGFEKGKLRVSAYDHAANMVLERFVNTFEQVEEMIGKDLAKKAEDHLATHDQIMFWDRDFKVGGEGMRTFYDKIVPKAADEVLKKLGGGKVGPVIVNGAATYDELVAAGSRTGLTQAQLDAMPVAERKALVDAQLPAYTGFAIGAALREKAMGGLPLFSQGEQGSARQKAKPGADVRRLTSLLGPQLYGNMTEMGPVTVKELFQNSFDALKGALEAGKIEQGRISIKTDYDARTITLTDNGTGMTPEVINKAFLTIAGTSKETERSSGGFGIAKMLFLFGNEKLSLVTVREGIESRMETTGEQLMAAFDNPQAAPEIETRRVDAPSGTTVTVTVPKTFRNPSTGEDERINFPDSYTLRSTLRGSPLFENIVVEYNGDTQPIGANFDKDAYTTFSTVDFDWGRARIIVSKKDGKLERYGPNVMVLSNGLYQFGQTLKDNPFEYSSEEVPRMFFINVEPRVKPEEAGYPFALNRQGFSPAVAADFDKIMRYLAVLYGANKAASNAAGFGQVEYVNADNSVSDKLQLAPKLDDDARRSMLHINEGDQIEVRDGRMIVNGREVPALTREDMEKVKIDFSKFKIAQDSVDATRPMVHDNLDLVFKGSPEQLAQIERLRQERDQARQRREALYDEYEAARDAYEAVPMSDTEALTLASQRKEAAREAWRMAGSRADQARDALEVLEAEVEALPPHKVPVTAHMRKEFGQRFDAYLGEMGRLFMALRDAVAAEDGAYAYLAMLPVGTSFDKQYYGVHTITPFRAMYLNPALSQMDTPVGEAPASTRKVANAMLGTMIHEIAHFRQMNHSTSFISEMQRLAAVLESSDKFNLNNLRSDLRSILDRHHDIYLALNAAIRGNVENRGVVLADAGTWAGRHAGPARKLAGTGAPGRDDRRVAGAAGAGAGTAAAGDNGGAAGGQAGAGRAVATWTAERIEYLLSAYAYTGDGAKSKAYAAWISPADYLALTTERIERVAAESRPLDAAELAAQRQEIYLQVDDLHRGARLVTGHEGRHRAHALMQAGVTEFPVVVYSGTGAQLAPHAELRLDGQDFGFARAPGRGVALRDATPISYDNAALLAERFGQASGAGPKFSRANAGDTDFQSWFSGSKVVDADGRPLVVYHGTSRDFDAFNTNGRDLGSHFGSLEQAQQFAQDNGARMFPAYLRIKNPLRLTDRGGFESTRIGDQLVGHGVMSADDLELADDMTESEASNFMQGKLKAAGYDGVVYLNRREGLSAADQAKQDAGASDNTLEYWDYVASDEQFRAKFPSAQDSYIVFSPEQVKAAIGNKGATAGAKFSRSGVTGTPEFKAWFGNSKVVDKDGRPLVVYHGTKSDTDFSAFNTPAHFGTADQANTVAEAFYRFGAPAAAQGDSPRLMPVYLAIKDPIYISDTGVQHGPMAYLEAVYEQGLLTFGERESILYDDADDAREEEEVQRLLIDNLESRGYDGFIYDNKGEGEGASYVVFRPEQVKSATGNAGTFDPANPDVRFSRRDDDQPPRKQSLPEFHKSLRDSVKARLEYMALLDRMHEWAFNVGDVLFSTQTKKTYRLVARSHVSAGPVREGRHVPAYYYESPDGEKGIFHEDKILSSKTMKSLTTPTGDLTTTGKVTDTPAFRRWFGGSKVVDKDGQPLVVYHGARPGTDIEAFKVWRHEGAYFTPDPGYAGAFTEDLFDEHGGAPGAMYPSYLSIQNPYVVEAEDQSEAWLQFIDRGLDREQLIARGYDGAILVHQPSGEIDQIIAFYPQQVKSATGNAGNFDPTNPDIRFSRASETVGQVAESLRSGKALRQLTDSAKAALSSHRSFNNFNWYDKTISTQYNKARKDADFRAVFEAAQQQVDDTAHYAIEAEQQAPDVLVRMDGFSEVWQGLKMGGTEYKADMAVVSRALFSNIEGIEGVHQIVYNDFELRRDFGMTDRQIALYRQVRRAVDTSIERLAQTTIMAMGRTEGLDVRAMKDMSLEDTVALVKEGLRERRQMAYFRERMLAISEGREEPPPPPPQSEDPVAQKIDGIVETAAHLQAAGYMPAMRFGHYAITVRDPNEDNADPLHFSTYETQVAAHAAYQRLLAEFPGMEVTRSVMNDEQFKMFKGVSPETVELFARFSGMDKTQAYHDYIALARANRYARKHEIERKGIAGFSEDAPRVLANFMLSNARQSALNVNSQDVAEALASKRLARKGDVQKEAQRLVEYLNNPNEEAPMLRAAMFAYFIGGSVGSALVNLTQPVIQTLPWLTEYVGTARASAILLAAARMATDRHGKKVAPQLQRAFARAANDGLTRPKEIHTLMADADASVVGSNFRVRALVQAWGGFFGQAEAFNRRVTFLAAYQAALDMGRPALAAKGFKDEYDFAKRALHETQGLYSKPNRPDWARGAAGAVLFTFKQFSVTYLEMLMRMPWKQKAIALALLTIGAGLEGWPFAENIEDLIDTLGQSMGYNTNTKRSLRHAAADLLGDDLGELLLHGAGRLTGADVAGRIGLGRMIPGTALLKPADAQRDVASEMYGPVGSLVKAAYQAVNKAQQGNVLGLDGALMTMMPTAIKNAGAGLSMIGTGQYRDSQGRKVMDVSVYEGALKFFGLQPASVAQQSAVVGDLVQDASMMGRVRSSLLRQWARAIVDGDSRGARMMFARLQEWNRDNPGYRVYITPRQLQSKVMELRRDRAGRTIRRVPRTMRAQAISDLSDLE